MSAKSRKEVLEQARARYRGRGRKGRSRLLDEVCALCGYERKYAIKLLGGGASDSWREWTKAGWIGSALRRGGASGAEGGLALCRTTLWGKRLHAALPNWLPSYEKRSGELSSVLAD